MCYALLPFVSELLVLVSVSSLGCGASRFACEAFVFVAVSFVGVDEFRASSVCADSQAHGVCHLPCWLFGAPCMSCTCDLQRVVLLLFD